MACSFLGLSRNNFACGEKRGWGEDECGRSGSTNTLGRRSQEAVAVLEVGWGGNLDPSESTGKRSDSGGLLKVELAVFHGGSDVA